MKIGLCLAIAIVFPFMVGFGIEAFYTTPENTYEACRSVDPTAQITSTDESKPLKYGDPRNDPKYDACYVKAQETLDIYSRNLFFIATALGFAGIIIGTLLFSEKLGPVGPGLVFGGLFTIVYGTMRTFRSVDKAWIFIELVFVLIGLILVTWRYIRTVSKNNKKK
jgi:hypothetical protein